MCLSILSGQCDLILRRIKTIIRKIIRILDLFYRLDIGKCIFHIFHGTLSQHNRCVRCILPGVILFYKGHFFPGCFFVCNGLQRICLKNVHHCIFFFLLFFL